MADIEYSIKSSLPIRVTIGASEASATICWRGAVKDNTNCLKCDEEKIYCENVYIGANDCTNGESSARTISADSATTTIFWHDIPIPYEIIQSAATCSSCGKESCDVELLNHWVSPYIITPTTTSTTLYWEYWLTDEFENDDCDIIREKVLSSTTITDLDDKDCDDPVRTVPIKITVPTTCEDKKFDINAEYFVQKPDVCCKLSGDCYEINEIVYSPTSVPSSGGMVDFSFDYKRIEIDENCETKETYGTYFGKWNVPECKGDECCYTKAVESAFTWFDICGRGDVSVCTISSNTEYDDGDLVYIPSSGASGVSFSSVTLNDKNTIYLSILREKSFSADCEVHCDFQTLYCVDKSTVYTEYYEYESGQWIGIASGLTEGNEPIKIINDYAYPYYGGRLRVSWEYYIITIYEDCTVGISKGNRYTDLLTIAEYDNCKDHEDTCNVHLTTKIDGNKEYICGDSGGTVTISVEGSSEPTCGLEISTSCVTYDGGDIKIEPKSSSNATSTRNLTRGGDESGSNNSSSNNGSCPSLKFKSSSCVTYDGGDITISLENGGCDYAFIVKPNCVPYSGGTITIEPIKGAKYFDIDYEFKTGLCSLPKDQLRAVKNNLPKNILPSDVCEDDVPCNEFKVSYLQISKPCNPDCVPCLYNYMIDDVPSARTVVTREIRSDCNLEVFAYGDGEKNGSTYKNDCSSWVTATIGSGVVTFTIAQNDGPYRRGKVIFTHDDGCKEEIVIIQNGINDSGDYIPDPGYECDLHLEIAPSCVGYNGGTITITPVGGGDATCKLVISPSCVGYGGGTITIIATGGDASLCTLTASPSCVTYDGGTIIITPNGGGGNTCELTASPSCVTYDGGTITITPNGSGGGGGDDDEDPYPDVNPDEDTLFKNLITSFNTVLTSNEWNAITTGSTKGVYDYLLEGYSRAVYEFNSNSSELFDKNTYSDMEVVDYRTSGTYNNKPRGLSAMTSWLMAMQLSEITPTRDNGNGNMQTKLFKKAYEIGGGHEAPLYGYDDIHSDISVVRLIASAIYAIMRAKYSFADIDSLRGKLKSSSQPINDPDKSWTEWQFAITQGDICSGIAYDAWYGARLDTIFNTPPGPFAKDFYEVTLESGGYWCNNGDKSLGRDIPYGQDSQLFDLETKNYRVDEQINGLVCNSYNLTNDGNYLKRAVQAVADESEAVQHIFADKTYYNYDSTNPFGTFVPASPSDNMGYFDGVFSPSVIGKDLSSLLTDGNNELTELGNFFGELLSIISKSRHTLLEPNYGRRRPGQGENDMSTTCGQCTDIEYDYPDLFYRCECDEDCVKGNCLDDTSITRLVGSGTKYVGTNPVTYYVDKNGNGYYDEALSEPIATEVIGLGPDELTDRCLPLNATTYPSGHSAGIWGLALFLIEMLPHKWVEIYKAAYRFTVSRTILRQHWNSDIIYGKLVATTTVPIVHAYNQFNDANFRDLFNRIKNQVENA